MARKKPLDQPKTEADEPKDGVTRTLTALRYAIEHAASDLTDAFSFAHDRETPEAIRAAILDEIEAAEKACERAQKTLERLWPREALARLRGAGVDAHLWRMGGNLEAAGVNLAVEGLHAYVTNPWDDSAEAVLVVGWDAPATEGQARALLTLATHGETPEDGGDDAVVFAGTLTKVLAAAVRLVGLAETEPSRR